MSAKANASAAWFKKAEGDLFAANAIRENSEPDSPHWDMVLFHAHQSIEKYLKGSLAANLASIPKTHDLPSLVRLCSQFVPDLLTLEADCDLVNRQYLSSRYPGMKDVSQFEAQRAIQLALAAKKTVLRSLQS
jgi:HEPN domain-containing protein